MAKKILMINDEELVAKSLVKLLKSQGYIAGMALEKRVTGYG